MINFWLFLHFPDLDIRILNISITTCVSDLFTMRKIYGRDTFGGIVLKHQCL